MLSKTFAFLYGAVPATFDSDLPVDHAVANLRNATSKSPFHSLMRVSAVGEVNVRKVSLQRFTPFIGTPLRPFFVGRFEVEGGKTQLRGVFTMNRMAKLFMSFWFGFGLLWSLAVLGLAIAVPKPGVWILLLNGLCVLLIGALMAVFFKWLARNDQEYLSQIITNALARNAS